MAKPRLILSLLAAALAGLLIGLVTDLVAPGMVLGESNQGTLMVAAFFAAGAIVTLGQLFVIIAPVIALSRARSGAFWARVVLAGAIASSLFNGFVVTQSFADAPCFAPVLMTLASGAHVLFLFGIPTAALFWLFVGGAGSALRGSEAGAHWSLGKRASLLLLAIAAMVVWEALSWGWIFDRVYC